jgi:hypothetical protein
MAKTCFILSALLFCACAGSKQAARPASSDPEVPCYLLSAGCPDSGSDGDRQVRDDISRLHQEEWRRFNAAASAFNVADGIDRAEAELLGGAYFSWQLGACGAVGDAQDASTEWRMSLRFGVTGTSLPDPIRVDKTTGIVSYAEGPQIQPFALLQIERARLEENLRRFVRRDRRDAG